MRITCTFGKWFYRALDSRRAVIYVVIVALVLASPSLTVGLLADDLIHQLMLRGSPGFVGMARRPFDLFNFASGNVQQARDLMNAGVFPWWTDPSTVLAFFRPISSWTHWLDNTFWPNDPRLMHLHSLAWFALLLWILACTYRRFETNRAVAIFALLLFAIDDAHAPVVAWVANRNMLIALALGVPALSAHDRWRRTGHRPSAYLAMVQLGLGLLAGEAAIVVVAYLVAYALTLDCGPWKIRLRSLIGYAVELAIWRLVYNAMGYGAMGSGIYLDPGHQPLQFAAAMLTRLPILLLGEFALPWSDSWEVFPLIEPRLRGYVLFLAYSVVLGLIWLMAPLWKRDRVFRFWTIGSLLATVPMCATFPHDRLLMGPGIGGMALLARFFGRGGTGAARGNNVVGYAQRLLVVLHLILAPIVLPLRIRSLLGVDQMFRSAHASITDGLNNEVETLLLLNPPFDPLASYFGIYSEVEHQYHPPHLLWLANGTTELQITRIDPRTLCVVPKGGFLSNATQHMLRSLTRPLKLGEKVALDAATFEITALTDDNRPAKVLIRFEKELESTELHWLQWGKGGYVEFDVPAVGNSVLVPAVDMGTVLFGKSWWKHS